MTAMGRIATISQQAVQRAKFGHNWTNKNLIADVHLAECQIPDIGQELINFLGQNGSSAGSGHRGFQELQQLPNGCRRLDTKE